MKVCLNRKVLAGLGAAGIGIYLVAPDLVVAALPILLLLACPLAMLLMMKTMQGSQGETQGQQGPQEPGVDVPREERIARLRRQQAALADRISALEQDEPRPAKNGKER